MSFLALLSPAKRLDFQATRPDLPLGEPQFATHARALIRHARQWSVADIAKKMNLSDALAALNHQRYQEFCLRGNRGPRQGALFAFSGDVYQGLDARTLSIEQVLAAQDHIRMLSGLYGLLRPLDAIQPYRLEMGTAVETARGTSLYAYWGTRISRALNTIARTRGVHTILNLASEEYFKAVDLKTLRLPVLTCHFKEMRDGKPKVISFAAKRARGLMARYLIESGAQCRDDLKGFKAQGYALAPDLSDEAQLTFLKQG